MPTTARMLLNMHTCIHMYNNYVCATYMYMEHLYIVHCCCVQRCTCTSIVLCYPQQCYTVIYIYYYNIIYVYICTYLHNNYNYMYVLFPHVAIALFISFIINLFVVCVFGAVSNMSSCDVIM